MICPKCETDSWKVKSSYRLKKNGLIVRVRVCNKCRNEVKTIEIPKHDYDQLQQLVKDFRSTVNTFLKRKPYYM